MWLYEELRRRNVIRVATAYVVAAWLAIQVVETVLPAFGFTDRAVRIVVILFAIGFVPAVIGAWVFQVTPDGLMRDRGVDSDAGSPAVARNLDRAIIVLLVLGLSYFAFDKFVLAPERLIEREAEIAEQARTEAELGFYGNRSIAVLPFDNLSPDPEQQYFADGVAEEVLNLLARIRSLRVISRSSSFTFRDRSVPVPDIAETLNVGYVLDGSIRRFGDRVRVTAQLIEGHTDTHIWSNTYERTLGDVFLIQDEIAADVARNLELEIAGQPPRSRPVDPEALALTQQAKLLAETRPPGFGRDMHELLSRALAIDSDYLPALEWITVANWFRRRQGFIDAAKEAALAKEYRQRILAIDPNYAMIDGFTAFGLAYDELRLEEAAELYLRALEKDVSNSNLVRMASVFARHIGKFDAALELGRHAVAIDPLCFQCLYQLSRTNMYAGNYERSLALRRQYMRLGEGGDYHHGLTLILMERPAEALEVYLAMPDSSPVALAGRAMAYHVLGRSAESEAALTALRRTDTYHTGQSVAEAAAWTGDSDTAFAWLFGLADKGAQLGQIDVFNPVWQPVHVDPRWPEFRERIRMSRERLEAIEFEPELPE